MNNIKILLTGLFLAGISVQCTKEVKPVSSAQMTPDQMLAFQNFGVYPSKMKTSPDYGEFPDRVYLGKVLYYDPILSLDGNNSCNSCHNLSTFGVDNESFSTGDKGEKGGRNSPTVIDAFTHFVQFWDGRAKDVEDQAGGPILNPVEMAMPSEAVVVSRLKATDYYPLLFKKAFPGEENPINYDNIKKAIGAFERTLKTESRLDKYVNGDANALSTKEIEGMKLFISNNCTSCHNGPTLGAQSFQKFGVYHPYAEYTKSAKVDHGKADLTNKSDDEFMFKVPSLRNVAKTHPYFHDGSVKNLDEAVRVMAKVQLDKDLSNDEVSKIVAFLKSTTADVSPEAKEIPKEIKQNVN